MTDQINYYDEVIIRFIDGRELRGTVLLMPYGNGGEWRIRENLTNKLFYVKMYETIQFVMTEKERRIKDAEITRGGG